MDDQGFPDGQLMAGRALRLMTDPIKILAFSGSTRTESLNTRLLKLAISATQKIGAEVTLIDLQDFPMPIYNGDIEKDQGLPANALKLREIMLPHSGLMIASPEYNSSISPILKNTLDWLSRPVGKEASSAFKGKTAFLLSASPGALGGLRGQAHLRAILEILSVLVLPETFALMKAHEAFNSDDTLKLPAQQVSLEKLTAWFVSVLQRLSVNI